MKSVSELFINRNDVAVTAATAIAVTLGLSLLLHSTKKLTSCETRMVPPMPKTTLPILKSLIDIAGTVDRFHDWLFEQCVEFNHRPWMYHIPGRPESIVLSSPETIEDVMSTQENIFLRGPVGQYISYDIFGKGMIIADGDQWYYHRKTASHLFSMQMMKDAMDITVQEKLGVFLDVLDIYHKRGKPFSIKKELLHFTMDVISKTGFGVELNTLKDSPNRETDHEFLQAFDSACVSFAVRIQTPIWIWRIKRFFNVGWEKVFQKDVAMMHNFINHVIMESMKKKTELAAKGEKMEGKDLISLFMESNLRETEDMQIEDDEITIMRDMVMTFIFAGKDTTAHSMCWFIVMMNRYPAVLRKIREEIKEKLPGLLTGEIRVPTQEQVRNLVYLEAAIKENLRLTPSTGFIARECMQDTTLVDGTFIKKGQTIMMSSFCNGRNKNSWGDDALEFKPERMINPETGKVRVYSPFKFSAFGCGPHICIGQRFAIMQLKMTLATLFSKYEVKTVEDPWKLTYEFSIAIPVKGPMEVEITPLAPETLATFA
ncbi:Cytochrome P450, E-class, group IV [Plasmopara halstedii]|uniref:Cytochrome P450, E-class, group IV n=1 Tax=Plasmopara halstedii TaxID=4781 RepID=A0A0P1B2I7_PLAHL|nr:Cytochrome P450, E-class, group IV [Plasmopara halstedii]CEG48480.1 Cytochrome P450, E-class, group IV [Plasmopara halstedii]|eukprot:XP_024584849.1 Cytochrome P450, E-class, group IV [Plasmopara halstedii]